MSHDVTKYFIYFRGGDSKWIADEKKAKKLQEALLSEECPRFFEIDGTVYSTSTIDRVAKETEHYFN